MSFDKKIDALVKRHKELSDAVSSPDKLKGGEFAKLSKDYSDLTPIIETALALRQATQELEEAKAMINGKDEGMKELALGAGVVGASFVALIVAVVVRRRISRRRV